MPAAAALPGQRRHAEEAAKLPDVHACLPPQAGGCESCAWYTPPCERVTSGSRGRGGGRPSRLTPLLAMAALLTTRDRSQNCPQESGRWAGSRPGTRHDSALAVRPGRRALLSDSVKAAPLGHEVCRSSQAGPRRGRRSPRSPAVRKTRCERKSARDYRSMRRHRLSAAVRIRPLTAMETDRTLHKARACSLNRRRECAAERRIGGVAERVG